MFLVNSRLGLVSATLNAHNARLVTYQVPLIPKLRGYFAEFLHHDYPDRLGILYLSTCVGLGYGRLTTRQRSFSRQHRITQPTPQKVRAHHVSGITECGFTYTPPYTLSLRLPTREDELPSCVPPRLAYYTLGSQTQPPTTPKGSRQSRMLSIACPGTDVVSPVREYQPVVHRLRLSASP